MKKLSALSFCVLLGFGLAQAKTPDAAPTAQPSATPTATPAPGTSEYVAPGFGTPLSMVEQFFKHLKSNSVDAAYTGLLRDSKIADSREDVATLKAKTREAIQAFGDILSWDLIATKPVGSHLISYTYIAAAKSYPVRWRFFFYKASDIWKLVDIRIDDRLPRMFDEVEPEAPASRAQNPR